MAQAAQFPKLDLDKLIGRDAADPARRQRLLALMADRSLAPELHQEVDAADAKARKEGEMPDFLWRGLVRTHTTVQGVTTYEKFVRKSAELPWDHASLSALGPDARKARLIALVGARREDNWRVGRLLRAFAEVGSPEGLAAAQARLRFLEGAGAKVAFFAPPGGKSPKPFSGFGPKYARLFWLDIRDADVSEVHMALDSRIQAIVPLVWPHLDTREGRALVTAAVEDVELYGKVERAFLALAAEARVEAWRADRTIFTMMAPGRWRAAAHFLCTGEASALRG
ncbi:hypothetical protein [Teichococcus aestuarii]|uniref:Uncharacterized protein n=1 Tax=Teichococcus aestuarii TaxID=568898 RepID=A0A2U1UXE8_9PROT|nr:hypothetical protein [Pseudoroseomonas aestuarii]PWC26343.1 hypothetical protein CR165_23720 [Pseudoroseomonas aestuarii]